MKVEAVDDDADENDADEKGNMHASGMPSSVARIAALKLSACRYIW